MSNPYESPRSAVEPQVPGVGTIDREKLRRVAKYQQWVIYSLLANIVINVVAVSTRGQDAATALALLGLALAIIVIAMIAIFLLANELYNVVIGVLCAILMIVPCVSLLTLLIVNQKATGFLQQHGVKVGFMGVNPKNV